MKMFWTPCFFLVTLAACGGVTTDNGPGSDSGESQIDPAVLSIVSPEDGSVFSEGDSVLLSAEAVGSVTGSVLEITALDWSLNAGEWGASGNEVRVTDLPSGALQLRATAEVAGREVVAVADLVVEPRRLELSGTMDAEVEVYSNEWDMTFEDDCRGAMAFVLEGSNLSGTGACEAFDEPIEFLVTGTENNGQVSGEMGVSGGEENVPFEGTWDDASATLTGSFDQTWESGDGTLRMVGSFSATAD